MGTRNKPCTWRMPSARPITAPPANTGSQGDCVKDFDVMGAFSVATDIPALQACIWLECGPMAY
ncbi:hypothetical protein SAMD00023378_4473 [Ralstonia sp. NT80]|nr:hypothetical protein SAMD00023378_4473 [Ralstonia sp. NT80]